MSQATLSRVAQIVSERTKADDLPLAHEDCCSSRSIRNKAEYAEQRRHMLRIGRIW